MFTDGFNETHVLDNFIIIYALLHSSRVGNRNSDNFLNIKREMLGKVNSDNVQYTQGNPCIVEYNFKNVYEYKMD